MLKQSNSKLSLRQEYLNLCVCVCVCVCVLQCVCVQLMIASREKLDRKGLHRDYTFDKRTEKRRS